MLIFEYVTCLHISGIACQRWDSNTPHAPNTKYLEPNLHPSNDVSLSENYCRNFIPDEPEGIAPWCYTMDPNKKWDYCEVPFCRGMCM